MAKLTALTAIRHDGTDYAEGDVLDVKDKAQAAELVETGAAAGTKAAAAAAADEQAA
jgi:hypothetical protein